MGEERLRPYAGGLLLDWLQTDPTTRHRAVAGSLAFVDISGFTRLTERLASRGKVGAEELSDTLDATFAALLEVAYSYGALLVKWGGDAVLLLFEGPDHERLAARAAHGMRALLARIGRLQTSAGRVTLRMSVGVHSGSFDFFLAGARHHELLIAGPAASVTAELEAVAEAGEIVVSPQTAAGLPPGCVGAAKGGGYLLRAAPPADGRCRFWASAAEPVDAAGCLDPAISRHLLTGGVESEHRQIAVGFVEVSGVDAALAAGPAPAVAAELDALIRRVQEACERCQVSFWETDISRDGFKILLVAGAPSTSGRDEEGLLRAAREILDRHDGPLRLRLGANCGRVFVGEFGPPFRRTFSVKGDAVNLAARVMGKAGPGQLIATEAILTRSHARFAATPLEPFLVKGKSRPVHAAVVGDLQRDSQRDSELPLVGRADELDRLAHAAAIAYAGAGTALQLTGAPGVGKTRLAAEIVAAAPADVRRCHVYADGYESATPYFPLRRLLRELLGLAPDAAADEAVRTLESRLAQLAPQLLPWLPLLAVPLGASLPDTPATAAIAPEFRAQRVARLLGELTAAVLPGPALLVVDDAHALDDATGQVLEELARLAPERHWLLLVAGRGAGRDQLGEELALGPLPPASAAELVDVAAGDPPLAPRAVRAIVARAEGNPLFVLELVRLARSSEDLPDTLEELLSAQVDALEPAARTVLRVAAVLGTQVEAHLLTALLGAPPDRRVWAQLAPFLDSDGPRHRFRNALLREAAYEGLPYRRRVALHARAADALEARGAGADQAGALSLHYYLAQRYEPAWRHARAAADRAFALYANPEALTLYRRALDSLRHLPDPPREELAALWRAIGDTHYRLVEMGPAIDSYRQARRRLSENDHPARAETSLTIALAATRAGQMLTATRSLVAARREALRITEQQTTDKILAQVAYQRAVVQFSAGELGRAQRRCQEALALADETASTDVLARTLYLADAVEVTAGSPGDDARAQRALALFQRSGDALREADAWNHLGARAFYAGRWNEAAELYDKARAILERCGDEHGAAAAAANRAEILLEQGHLGPAELLLRSVLRVWTAAEEPRQAAFGLTLLGRLLCASGRVEVGLEVLRQARAGYLSCDARLEAVEPALRVVEALSCCDPARAVAAFTEAESELRSALGAAGIAVTTWPSPDAPYTQLLLRVRAALAAQEGDTAVATADLRQALELARVHASQHDTLLDLSALCLLGELDGDEREELLRLQSDLGCVAVPASQLVLS